MPKVREGDKNKFKWYTKRPTAKMAAERKAEQIRKAYERMKANDGDVGKNDDFYNKVFHGASSPNGESTEQKLPKKKSSKPSIYAKQEREYEVQMQQKAKKDFERRAREKELKQKERVRSKKGREVNQRTKKGQVKMKVVVNRTLDNVMKLLEKEKRAQM